MQCSIIFLMHEIMMNDIEGVVLCINLSNFFFFFAKWLTTIQTVL
jgi:hypothetical protein